MTLKPCAPVLAKGSNLGGRSADGHGEKSNRLESPVTTQRWLEPIRIDRASTETLALDSSSVHVLPRGPTALLRNFRLARGGRQLGTVLHLPLVKAAAIPQKPFSEAQLLANLRPLIAQEAIR